jgi:hypothetical protein
VGVQIPPLALSWKTSLRLLVLSREKPEDTCRGKLLPNHTSSVLGLEAFAAALGFSPEIHEHGDAFEGDALDLREIDPDDDNSVVDVMVLEDVVEAASRHVAKELPPKTQDYIVTTLLRDLEVDHFVYCYPSAPGGNWPRASDL